MPPQPSKKDSWLGSDLPLEHETSLFILVSTFDLLMTVLLLRHPGFVESNRLAAWFLLRWGIQGMTVFKFALVAVICILTQVIARLNHRVAQVLLGTATGAMALVVIYSLTLLIRGLAA